MLARLKPFGVSWKWFIIGTSPYLLYALLNWLTPSHQLISILDDAAEQSAAEQTRFLIIGGVIAGIFVLMIAFALLDLFDKERFREVFTFTIWISFALWMLTITTKQYLNVQFDESKVNVVSTPITNAFVVRSPGRRGGDVYTGFVRVKIPNSEQVVIFVLANNLPGNSYTPPAQVSFVYGKGYLGSPYVQNVR